MNKQTLIEDYKQTIERLQKECTEKTSCIIYLCEKLNEYDARVKKLEEKLKWYDHYKNSVLELKEKCNKKIDEIEELQFKLNIANKTIGGLKVHVKEMDKLLDKLRDKINDNNINLNKRSTSLHTLSL